MALIRIKELNEITGKARAILDEYLKRPTWVYGRLTKNKPDVAPHMKARAWHPDYLEAAHIDTQMFRRVGVLRPIEKEMIHVATSVINRCNY